MSRELRHESEIRRLEATLRPYGVLTRKRLAELAHCDGWPTLDTYRHVLEEACAAGRLRLLGDDLVELPPESERSERQEA